MTDIPQTTLTSHLKNHMDEVMAALRVKSMNLLVDELIRALAQEKYQLNEFIDALGDYSQSLGWQEVTKHLEIVSTEIVKIRREGGDFPR
jgi:hypothetical protein